MSEYEDVEDVDTATYEDRPSIEDLKSALLAPRADGSEELVLDIGTVRIRPLTRSQAQAVAGKNFDSAVAERKLIAMAMVEPEMNEADVRQWQKVAPAGEIQRVFDHVVRVSGMESSATKAAYKSDRS
jgi:hypothetical protein